VCPALQDQVSALVPAEEALRRPQMSQEKRSVQQGQGAMRVQEGRQEEQEIGQVQAPLQERQTLLQKAEDVCETVHRPLQGQAPLLGQEEEMCVEEVQEEPPLRTLLQVRGQVCQEALWQVRERGRRWQVCAHGPRGA